MIQMRIGRQAARRHGLAITAALLASGAVPAKAETLAEAIALAYQTNPTLQEQRAVLRGTDETYVQARSQYGPTLDAEMGAHYSNDRFRDTVVNGQAIPNTTSHQDAGSVRLTATQPLYTAGRATLGVQAAKWRIWSGREALRITEGDVIFSVIQAYADVRRDQQALVIRKANRDAIAAQLAEIQARQRAGELTRTDVAQAEAQLFAEAANVASAENQLRTSQVAYASVVGRNPGDLEAEPELPNLPRSADEAWGIAQENAPEFQQALFNELQSRTRLAEARASTRATLSLRGSAGYSSELFPFATRNFDRAIVGELVLSKPLFAGGYNRSVVRQATEQNDADRLGIEAARRSMIQSTANAWNQMLTLRGNIDLQTRQRDAADLAFRGVRIEYRAGERSTLDVLIAEEVLRDAELARLNAMHDAYLSEALLLRYIGRLDASDIVASLPRYEPEAHFRSIEHKGAMPWEPLVRMLDGVRLPHARQNYIPAPDPAIDPTMGPARDLPETARPVSRVPVEPIPGTVSGVPAPVAADGDIE